jgi:hypothetical protein
LTITNDDTPVSAGQLIISEFRLRGPASASDEFIEIYNNSNSPHTVGATDASAGYGVAASDGVLRCTIPNGTTIPAHGHYLCVNSVGYSLASYPAGDGTTATGDATYTTDIPDNAGIALFSSTTSFTLPNRLDAVGSTSEANTLYKEGTGYPPLTSSIDYSFFRDLNNATGTPKDTDNNGVDFVFADTQGTFISGVPQHLGAPGPENLSSPTQRNATVKASLIDPGCTGNATTATQACPRYRDFTPGPSQTSPNGTLSIRRRFTNNTGQPLARLRFRIVDVTTFPSPGAGTADLRAITSSDQIATCIGTGGGCASPGAMININGTTLETPPTQPNGGGFNSSLSAGTITLATPLASGASINLQFVVGVVQPGSFRFFINVEAQTNPPSLNSKQGQKGRHAQ